MALSNLFGWHEATETVPAAACGSACGAGDKPESTPAENNSTLGSPAGCSAGEPWIATRYGRWQIERGKGNETIFCLSVAYHR